MYYTLGYQKTNSTPPVLCSLCFLRGVPLLSSCTSFAMVGYVALPLQRFVMSPFALIGKLFNSTASAVDAVDQVIEGVTIVSQAAPMLAIDYLDEIVVDSGKTYEHYADRAAYLKALRSKR